MLTDASAYVIPDGFTAFGAAWALLLALFAFVRDDPSVFAGPGDAVIGACVGAGAIAIVGWIGEMILKKEAMGFGDVTLMAMAGAHLGAGRSLLTIFLGAFIGAVVFGGVVMPISYLRSRKRGRGVRSAARSLRRLPRPGRDGRAALGEPTDRVVPARSPGTMTMRQLCFALPVAAVALAACSRVRPRAGPVCGAKWRRPCR